MMSDGAFYTPDICRWSLLTELTCDLSDVSGIFEVTAIIKDFNDSSCSFIFFIYFNV